MTFFWQALAMLAIASLLFELSMVLRRGVQQQLGYFGLSGAATAWLGWVVQADRMVWPSGAPRLELLAGLLGCALLVVVPGVLERRVRRAFADEDYQGAARLAAVRELLVPGRVAAAEREFFERIAAARAGRSDDVVRELRLHLVEAEPPLDAQIQEQIVTVLLFAHRWREAATQFETHLGEDPSRHPTLAVQMVRAYGALGELEHAAQLLHRLEERLHPADPTAQALLLQARLQLLAFAGALPDVERLLGEPALQAMPARLRASLLETARERSGMVGDARADAGAGPGPGAQDAGPGGTASPSEPLLPVDRHLALFLHGVALRAANDLRSRPAKPARVLPSATLTLIALNVCAYLLFYLLLGDPAAGDRLVRGGASFHVAVRAGEWWRLWTAMFLHGGIEHLLLNLYGLFVLGRVVEPVLGTVRFLCVYAVAGLAGNLASVYNPSPAAVFSLGASGAVLGVMAALMVALVLRRSVWPEGGRREVLVNLGVLLVIQLAIGSWWDVIDNYAHVGGLLGGAAAAMLLAPGGLLGRGTTARVAVLALLLALTASAGRAVVSLVREDPAETLARLPRLPLRLGPVTLLVPAGSEVRRGEPEADHPNEDERRGPDLLVVHALGVQMEAELVLQPATPEEVIAAQQVKDAEQRRRQLRERDLEVSVGMQAGPKAPGWHSGAQSLLAINVASGEGQPGAASHGAGAAGRESLRLLYFARAEGPAVLLLTMMTRVDGGYGKLIDDELVRALGSVVLHEGALGTLPIPMAPAAPAREPATAPPDPAARAPR